MTSIDSRGLMDEFKFLQKTLKSSNGTLLIQGPGDDCSVVPYSENEYLIATTDCLVEDVHFRIKDFSPKELAYKALAVNISDISAMGGVAKWLHLSLALPAHFSEAQASEFFKEVYRLCDLLGIALAGGDLSRSEISLFINVHLSGLVEKSKLKLRSDFLQADCLCVTGNLGESGAGLASLLLELNDPQSLSLITAHKTPPIENNEAQWLGGQKGVHGMMDLSDGLISDLARIVNLSATIDLDEIPLSESLKTWCETQGKDPLEFALGSGEDYRLLFGCSSQVVKKIQTDFREQWSSDFFIIGAIDNKSQGVRWTQSGKPFDMKFPSFKHFNKP